MSPILTDGLHPVGGMWPAGDKLFFDGEGKERFCGVASESSAAGNYLAAWSFFPARACLRHAAKMPNRMQTSTPAEFRLLTMP